MSIEEKKRPLEFQFVDKKMGDIVYDIKYETDGRSQPLIIICESVEMRFPLSFFEEVGEFLKNKGILKSNKPLIREGNISIDNVSRNLPLPDIQKIGTDSSPEIFHSVDPISSFNVSNIVPIGVNPVDVNEDSIGSTVVIEGASEEIIKRPVIKTRIQGDDPMSAENEAKKIRGIGKGAKKNMIKRKES